MGQITLTLNELLEYFDDVGLSEYPIHDEEHREILNTKILNHYDAQEIGFESGERFIFALKRRMAEIMPLYNQLYESELLVLSPLKTIDMHSTDDSSTTADDNTTGVSTTTTNNSSTGRSVSYVMPQVALGGSKDYADSAGDSTSSGVSTGDVDNSGTAHSETTSHSENSVTGWQGSQAELLQAYRETFLNIDLAVINALADLFMQVWDTGDSYASNIPGFNYYGRVL
jgi:hypothetical protein